MTGPSPGGSVNTLMPRAVRGGRLVPMDELIDEF